MKSSTLLFNSSAGEPADALIPSHVLIVDIRRRGGPPGSDELRLADEDDHDDIAHHEEALGVQNVGTHFGESDGEESGEKGTESREQSRFREAEAHDEGREAVLEEVLEELDLPVLVHGYKLLHLDGIHGQGTQDFSGQFQVVQGRTEREEERQGRITTGEKRERRKGVHLTERRAMLRGCLYRQTKGGSARWDSSHAPAFCFYFL
ncbi:hypothetical protein H6P81_012031 [Aristolochia fimbriata]|uniref:Uncharacterized protein n=1 Tax=Aristolochia fimbriata TaxID=158543 RepID=A0AAV7EB05_ARIFI|nr:hypothetical protein H6P81_012031 [Aristolochia fimbriata]